MAWEGDEGDNDSVSINCAPGPVGHFRTHGAAFVFSTTAADEEGSPVRAIAARAVK